MNTPPSTCCLHLVFTFDAVRNALEGLVRVEPVPCKMSKTEHAIMAPIVQS